MKHCTVDQFRDMVSQFDKTNTCHYGQYGINFWNGMLIAWDKTGTYKLKEMYVGCHGGAINKLREFVAILDSLEESG